MAINILVEPTNPPIAGDFTLDQAIQQACETPVGSILTLWEDTASIPAAQQTSFIRHAGNTFQVQGSNESISGSLSAGINYIAATESAGVITLEWVTSLTGYAYNQAYGGIYNGSGMQLLRDICSLDGSDYIRGRCFGQDFNSYYLANGDVYVLGVNATDLILSNDLTVGNDLTVDGNILPESSGNISLTLGASATYTLPRGVYSFANSSGDAVVEVSCGAGYKSMGAAGTIFSNGSSARFRNASSTLITAFYYRQH